jgi:hypothetical protein
MRRALILAAVTAAAAAPILAAQDVRGQIQSLAYPALRFNPPTPKRLTLSNGVAAYLLEDHALPTLSVQLVSRRGTDHVPDSLWGVAWQADGMLRTGGTTRLTPDSVDQLLEFYGINLFVSTDHEQSTATVSGLSRYRDQMLDLAFDVLRNPRNDTSRIRITVAQQQESWRRRNDQPGSVLNRAWSQVVLGDHPLGRSLVTPDELAGFTPEPVPLGPGAPVLSPEPAGRRVGRLPGARPRAHARGGVQGVGRLQTRPPRHSTGALRCRTQGRPGREGREPDQHPDGPRGAGAGRRFPGVLRLAGGRLPAGGQRIHVADAAAGAE